MDSGIPKDARDTVTRRQRHKDGKLLRGGLGLTTGLGWSDSEASRRISKATSKSKSYGNLRQASSVSSLRSRPATARSSTYSSQSHGSSKLSRSYSSRTLGDFDEDEEVDEFGYIRDGKSGNDVKGKEKLPPTSWQGKSFGLLKNGERMRTASESSASVPYVTGVQPRSLTMPQSLSREEIETPSTASSVSIPLPVTPDAYDFDENGRSAKTPTIGDTLSKTTIGEVAYQRLVVDKDKMLPPLPNPRTGSIRRPQAGALAARRQASAAARGATLSIATAEGISLAPSYHETTAVSNSTSTTSNSNSTTVTASSIPTPRRSGSRSSSLRSSSSSASLRNAPASQAHSQSQIPPVPTLPNQPLRQLQLPRYSANHASSGSINTHKQTAVPVPSTTRSISGNVASPTSPPRKPTLSGSISVGSLRSPQGVRTAPSTPVTPSTPGRPRTGTGMTYRRSGSVNGLSALKLPSSRSTGAV
ncbi:hypothetical protein D9758_008183 [Tetrapyrgos nigripes]|uniref:Uncharacterized protein n=1 Tax=Tetrapyrgos nigripes TaxID=182062 RepID=A0A8H5LPQ7_9AGAR|nr:hypothetical protein D9758_008183 [Tetrapyrgos nigripes]